MSVPQNIQELANKVRNEIYGRDVRESIAKSMEATGEVAEWSRQVAQDIVDGKFDEGELATEIERKLNDLETQYTPQLTNVKNEIENARGNEANLGDRLNSVDSQLADTAQEVDELKTTKAEKDHVNFELEKKVNHSDVRLKNVPISLNDADSEFIAAVQNKPGETTFNLLSVPRERSVTPEKTTFAKNEYLTPNLFDKDNIIPGGYFRDTTGVWYDSLDYNTSHLIEVTEGQAYTQNVPGYVNFYDENEHRISGVNGPATFNIPTGIGVKYVRITVRTPNLETEMLVKGSALPLQYYPYNRKVTFVDAEIQEKDVNFLSLNLNKDRYFLKDSIGVDFQNMSQVFTRDSANLINPNTIIPNRVPSLETGELVPYTGYSSSDFIEVNPGKSYIQNEKGYKVFYDSNKEFISSVNDFSSGIAPLNASYLRVAISNINIPNNTILVEGEILPAYESYFTYKFSDDIKPNDSLAHPLSNLKWNALGDSITFGTGATKPYVNVIAERTGIKPRNYGIHGSRITTADDRTDSMSVRYAEMDTDADIITVFGGTNDSGYEMPIGAWGDVSDTTLYGAMTVLIEGLLTKYTGKRIGFILPTPRQNYSSPTSRLKEYVNVIEEVCDRYSIPTLDLYTGSGISVDYQPFRDAVIPDGVHPNDVGHMLISYKIQDFLTRI